MFLADLSRWNKKISADMKFSRLRHRERKPTFFNGAAAVCAGLEDQGLYRVVGVASKVTKLLNMGLDRRKLDKINLGKHKLII